MDMKLLLAKDYPRLDVRLGDTYARPWFLAEKKSPIEGWIDENGFIVPFEVQA